MKTLAKWSVADYNRLIETGFLGHRNVELVAGEIIEMSPEGPLHYSLASGMADYLQKLLRGFAHVRFNGPISLATSQPQPDIAIVKLPKQQYRHSHPTPAQIFWIIEVSHTTLDYDTNEKKLVYAQAGIQEYWVVDVNQQQLNLFRQPVGNDYQIKSVVREGNITPKSFPEIHFSLQILLSEL